MSEAHYEYACRVGTKTAIDTRDLEILGDGNAPALDPIAWYGGNRGHENDHDDGDPITWLKDKSSLFRRASELRLVRKRGTRPFEKRRTQ
jgi:hypothetical protein